MIIRFFMVVASILYLLTSCQREISTELGNNSTDDSAAFWVVVHKKAENYDTVMGNIPFTVRAGYFYDTVTRTITELDSVMYEGGSEGTHQAYYTYDAQGRLIKFVGEGSGTLRREANLFYNAEGMLERVNTGSDVNFTWTQQGNELKGESRDPLDVGVPFSDGNMDFTLNNDRKLMKIVHISDDPTYTNIIDEVVRDAQGSAILRKTYSIVNGEYDFLDSVLYIRDYDHEPRLSRFYAMLGHGIEWYSDYYGIRFINSPSLYSEYFEFDQTLCNKVVNYVTYKDENGQWQSGRYSDKIFTTEYDTNGNPVKQTVLVDGLKIREITFRWQKLKWLKQ